MLKIQGHIYEQHAKRRMHDNSAKRRRRKFSVLAICLLKPVKLVEADILKSGHLMVAYGSSRLANLAIRTTEAEVFVDTDMSLFNLEAILSKINSSRGSVFSEITGINGITSLLQGNQGRIRSVA